MAAKDRVSDERLGSIVARIGCSLTSGETFAALDTASLRDVQALLSELRELRAADADSHDG